MSGSAVSASLALEAYTIVRQRILRGEIPIGEVISRRKLASELGMSLLPVSEALQRLECEGLLESRPRAGTRVRMPTRRDVRGHFILREALEGQAAKLFSEAATAKEKEELMKLAARVDALSVSSDASPVAYLELHDKLHHRIAACARCPALLEAIEKTHALASTWMCCTRPPQPGRTVRRHQDLMAVLSNGDPEQAAATMREHIAGSMENSLKRLEPYFKLRRTYGEKYGRRAVPSRYAESAEAAE